MAIINSLSGIWDQVYHILQDKTAEGEPLDGATVSQNIFMAIPDEIDALRGPFPQVVVFYLHDAMIQDVKPQAASDIEREFTTLHIAALVKSSVGAIDAGRKVMDLADAVKAVIKANRGLAYDGDQAGERASIKGVSFRIRQDLDRKAWYGIAGLRLDVINSRS